MKKMSLEQLREMSARVQYALPLDMDADEAQRWIDDADRGIQLISGKGVAVQDAPKSAPIAKKLLELVTSANVPALPQFTAADHFKEDLKGAVRIWSLDINFTAKFFPKVEKATVAADIKVHKLLQRSRDPAIMTELGNAHEMMLGQFFHLIANQGMGGPGPLLVNGWANIAYIQDVDGNFWAVSARWDAGFGGWSVDASSVEDPDGWVAGFRILSR